LTEIEKRRFGENASKRAAVLYFDAQKKYGHAARNAEGRRGKEINAVKRRATAHAISRLDYGCGKAIFDPSEVIPV